MATYVSGSVTVIGSNVTPTDTTWRAWINEMRAAFSGVGLVQTSDTGQIDPTTATVPGTGTDGGYEIWRFSDAAQATDPVFIKITYRRGGTSSGRLTLKFQVGQGTNGAGTLTGTLSTIQEAFSNNATTSASTTAQHYAFFGDGCFWIADAATAAAGGYYGPRNYFNISRTRDDSGALDGRGILVLTANVQATSPAPNAHQFVRRASGIELVYPAGAYYCMPVGTPTSDPVGARFAWPHLYRDGNTVKYAWATWSARRTGFTSLPTAFDAAPYGTTRRWICWTLSPTAHMRGALSDSDNYDYPLVMLWE